MLVIVNDALPFASHVPAMVRLGGRGVDVDVRVGVTVGETQNADALTSGAPPPVTVTVSVPNSPLMVIC